VDAEIRTNERGETSRIEANIQLALRQRRISFTEVPRWRNHYRKVGYELATTHLLSRKADPTTLSEAAAPVTYSEAAYIDYAQRCGIPGYRATGYMRSVV
jgi:hypothetical protein